VRVAAPAERGRANDAVLELVARTIALPRDRVSLVAGASARDKIVLVEGLAADEAGRRLDAGVARSGA
jgi:uncharacterized protein YggU (UPF0235/DUF167 family)